MKKHLFAIVLVASVLILLSALSEENGLLTEGNFVYAVHEDEVHIVEYIGDEQEVIIPELINGLPVVSVKFSPATYPEDPNTGNYTVTRIHLPQSIVTLDRYAFNDYRMLMEIEGLEQVKRIEEGAFSECWKLRELRFSKELRYISCYAFRNARFVTKIVIPDDVIIEDAPFGINLNSLDGVELIRGNQAATLVSIDGVIYSSDEKTLVFYPPEKQTKSFIVPGKVTRLMRDAFANIVCAQVDYLCEIALPKTVNEIDNFPIMSNNTFRIILYEDSFAYRYLSENYSEYYNLFIVDSNSTLEEATYESMLSKIIGEIVVPDMSEYQIALAFHDWILDHASYDYSLKKDTALDILLYGTGVCESYSELYRDLLSSAGVKNALVQTLNHQFNVVQIDGEWCYIDCTWDDAGDCEDVLSRHRYFGYEQSLMIWFHHYEVAHYETTAQHHFWYMDGYLDNAIEQLTALINQQLMIEDTAFSLTIDSSLLQGDVEVSGRIAASVLSRRDWVIGGDLVELTVSFNYEDGLVRFDCMIVPCLDDPGGFEYQLNAGENGWVLLKYNGEDVNVEIPDEYMGLPVTSISNGAFADCYTRIESIKLPKNLRSIESMMFLDCVSLKTVVFPEGLTEIGWYAFGNCYSLREAIIPDSVYSISGGAFSRCYALQKVRIPSNANMNSGVFEYCKNLTEVVLAEGITTLPASAFLGCEKLAAIHFPASLERVGASAFALTALTTIDLPANLSGIEGNPFYGCNMTSINVSADNKCFFERDGLLIDTNGTLICAEEGAIVGDYSVDTAITSIGDYAFAYNSELTSISIPGNVTNIGAYAFEYCDSLRVITIEEGVESIGEFAFQCTFATQLSLPDSIRQIGEYAFYACGFDSITIPKSMKSFNVTVVAWSISLIIHKDVVEIGDWYLYENQEVTKIYGRPNSYAEQYATEHGFTFCSLWNEPEYEWTEDDMRVKAWRSNFFDETFVESETVASSYEIAQAPTCVQPGEGLYTALFENDGFEPQTKRVGIPAFGHSVTATEALAPTCTETGLTEGSHCSVCGEVLVAQEVIPALGHTTVTDSAVSPTCTATGLIEGSHPCYRNRQSGRRPE